MKLKKYVYLHSKLIRNYTLKIMKNTWKFTKKTWKNHGNIMEFCQSGKVGTLDPAWCLNSITDYIVCA